MGADHEIDHLHIAVATISVIGIAENGNDTVQSLEESESAIMSFAPKC